MSETVRERRKQRHLTVELHGKKEEGGVEKKCGSETRLGLIVKQKSQAKRREGSL